MPLALVCHPATAPFFGTLYTGHEYLTKEFCLVEHHNAWHYDYDIAIAGCSLPLQNCCIAFMDYNSRDFCLAFVPAMYRHHLFLCRAPRDRVTHPAFYTGNPLLYTATVFDIVAGSDVIGHHQTALSKSSCLSACRDLVERLDSTLVFEYLLQNGVIGVEESVAIRSESTLAKVNLALLRHLEESRVCGARSLFVNALRQTGQHQLASLLDDGVRLRVSTNSGETMF